MSRVGASLRKSSSRKVKLSAPFSSLRQEEIAAAVVVIVDYWNDFRSLFVGQLVNFRIEKRVTVSAIERKLSQFRSSQKRSDLRKKGGIWLWSRESEETDGKFNRTKIANQLDRGFCFSIE